MRRGKTARREYFANVTAANITANIAVAENIGAAQEQLCFYTEHTSPFVVSVV